MQNRNITLALCGILVLLTCNAHAINVQVTGTEITVTGQEPVTNEDTTPLLDLDHTNVYWQKDTDNTPTKEGDIPATSSIGGGDITHVFMVPVSVGEDTDISVWGTATDDANNESKKSNIVIKNIDKQSPAGWQ